MSTNKGAILAVDDDPECLKLLDALLSEAGYKVRLAKDGKRALASVAAERTDLILLDIKMADMDGFEIFRRLQAGEKSRGIPVIFLSGTADIEQRTKSLKLGAVDFILKPIPCEELLVRVQTHLKLHRLRIRLNLETVDLRHTNDMLDQLLQTRDRELREATAAAVRAAENEQQRIGRDLHDHLCQDLASLVREIEGINKAIPNPGAARPGLERMAAGLNRALQSARGFAHDLAVADLGFISLETSLIEFTQHAATWFGLEVELNYGAHMEVHEPEAAGHMLRIVREAVINGVRHGHASRFWIDVVHKDGKMLLSVSNDGEPLPKSGSLKEGLGFRQMQMRTRLLGGILTIQNCEAGVVQALLSVDRKPVLSAPMSAVQPEV